MPQLVRGGKYIFGWTTVNRDLKIRIPDETFVEYRFAETEKLIILSGSRTSGGFSIIAPGSMVNSKLGKNIAGLTGYDKATDSFSTGRLEIIRTGKRLISWTSLEINKYFRLSEEMLGLMRLRIGSRLLVGRGSGLGPAFIAKGPIYSEALNHGEILEYH